MKINELTGYKSDPTYQHAKTNFAGDLSSVNTRTDKLLQFQTYLTNNGFTPLGLGQAGVAFTHPTYPWVFKIFTHDQGYQRFISYALRHQNNPHIPKLKGNLMRINPTTYVIRIEKLDRCPLQQGTDSMKILSRLGDLEDIQMLTPDEIEILNSETPGMLEIITDLAKEFPTHILDLHRQNILGRNGTLVLTDPLI